MYVRLAFAVAAHLEPEILVVDEVLAVGDAAFQKRCLGKMGDVARDGRTVLFVSHNMASIEALCGSCIVISGGRVEAIGAPAEMVARYMTSQLIRDSGARDLLTHSGRTRGSIPLMNRVNVRSQSDAVDGGAKMGADLMVEVSFAAPKPIRPILTVTIKTAQGAPVFGVSNRWTRHGCDEIPVPHGVISCNVARLPLMPGTYTLDLHLGDFGDQTRELDSIIEAATLEVFPADVYGTGMLPRATDGPVFCDARWSLATNGAELRAITSSGG
jgi:lipopolysaccharide transport system ATP-binding protein